MKPIFGLILFVSLLAEAQPVVNPHPSWFEKPTYADQEAVCNDRSCVCAAEKFVFANQANRSVKSLAELSAVKLPRLWKAYEKQVAKLEALPKDDPKSPFHLKRVQQSACQLRIYQVYARDHYQEASKTYLAEMQAQDKAFNQIKLKCEDLRSKSLKRRKTPRLKCKPEERKAYRKAKRDSQKAHRLNSFFSQKTKHLLISREDDKKAKELISQEAKLERIKAMSNPALQKRLKEAEEKKEKARQIRIAASNRAKERVFQEIDSFNTQLPLSEGPVAEEAVWTGYYLLNADTNQFTPCYQKETYFLTGTDQMMKEVKQTYKKIFRKPEKPLFLSVTGNQGPKPKGALAHNYDGSIAVKSIHRFLRGPGTQCGNYYGLDALDIHPTWLESPKNLAVKATCNKDKCSCLKINRFRPKNNSELQFRVERVVEGLKWAWKAYEKSNTESNACNLLVSQKILELHYPEIAKKIGTEYKEYMDSLRKEESQCVHPNTMGWTKSEEAKEYVSCLNRVSPKTKEIAKAARGTKIRYFQLKKALGIMNKKRVR